MLKSGQERTMPAQLGQLKIGQGKRDCCNVIHCALITLQGYGIELNRIDNRLRIDS